MQATAKCPSGNLRDMFQNIFRISTVCGLFPFVFSDHDLILSSYFLAHSIMNMTVFSGAIVYLLVYAFMNMEFITYAFAFSYFIPFAFSLIVPNVSLFWLLLNLKKLRKVFRALKVVQDVTKKRGRFYSYNHHLALFLIVIAILAFDMKISHRSFWETLFIYWMNTNVNLVMIQFTTILTIIGRYYSFLRETLRTPTAAEWTQCHEVLGACCEIVNNCYSPQLFIFTLSTFTFITSTIYNLIAQRTYFNDGYRIVAMMWVFLLFMSLWAFIHHCHDTVHKVSFHFILVIKIR